MGKENGDYARGLFQVRGTATLLKRDVTTHSTVIQYIAPISVPGRGILGASWNLQLFENTASQQGKVRSGDVLPALYCTVNGCASRWLGSPLPGPSLLSLGPRVLSLHQWSFIFILLEGNL